MEINYRAQAAIKKPMSNWYKHSQLIYLQAEQQTQKSGMQVAVDVGNRLIKYRTGQGVVKVFSSWHKDLEEWDTPKPDENSAIITYLGGDNPALVDNSWAVGTVAQDLGGMPTYESEKAFLAPKLVLAMIDPQPGVSELTVNRLVCSLPNDLQTDKVELLIQGLIGNHHIIRNGQSLNIEIRSVEVQPETLGAYKYALANRLFNFDTRNSTNNPRFTPCSRSYFYSYSTLSRTQY